MISTYNAQFRWFDAVLVNNLPTQGLKPGYALSIHPSEPHFVEHVDKSCTNRLRDCIIVDEKD